MDIGLENVLIPKNYYNLSYDAFIVKLYTWSKVMVARCSMSGKEQYYLAWKTERPIINGIIARTFTW